MIKSSDYNHKLYQIVKEGRSGDWELIKTIYPPGKLTTYFSDGYCGWDDCDSDWLSVELHDANGPVMTDSPLEQESYRKPVELARGKVLMCGLGIGLFPILVENKLVSGEITRLDIVEIEPHIIELVNSYLDLPNCRVIPGNAWEYLAKSKERYDFIFIDPWNMVQEAIAKGPEWVSHSRNCLTERGISVFWMQKILESLNLDERSTGELVKTPCLICSSGYMDSRLDFYGGLCMECAYSYETFRGGFEEKHSNDELAGVLRSKGQAALREYTLSNGQRVDIIVEGDKKYIIEVKDNLTNMEGMVGKLTRYHTNFKDEFAGVRLVVYGAITWSVYIWLKEEFNNRFNGWVEVFCENIEGLKE